LNGERVYVRAHSPSFITETDTTKCPKKTRKEAVR